jgi:hypothetical protein
MWRAVVVLAAVVGIVAGAGASCDPPPPCPAGGLCATDAACAPGYHCLDNGTGTKYCVGPVCAADADCGAKVVCRAYCVSAGGAVECPERRCQCAGFGCVGSGVLCTNDGGLACRMFCTQDSDCVGAFGLVCVNPGFGAGTCIGTVPCQ